MTAATAPPPVPGVLLDKDGTLIEDIPYNVDPGRIRFTPGADRGLRLLHAAGFRLVVVSNQSGVARGFFDAHALTAVEERIRALMSGAGVPLAGFYYCPHHPDGNVARFAVDCCCRKPAPGMLLLAAHEQQLDLGRSWLIGDILDDIEAGRSAGCRTVLIANGNETVWDLSPGRAPHFRAADLQQAAEIVCREAGREGATHE